MSANAGNPNEHCDQLVMYTAAQPDYQIASSATVHHEHSTTRCAKMDRIGAASAFNSPMPIHYRAVCRTAVLSPGALSRGPARRG